MILKTTTAATTLMILANNMPSALSSEPKLRGATSSSAYLATDSRVIEQADMDGLADAFCGAAVAISDVSGKMEDNIIQKTMLTHKRHVMRHMKLHSEL